MQSHEPLSSGMVTVYDAFRRQCALRPDDDALVFPDMDVSFAKLGRIVDAFTRKLKHDHGVGAKSILMLHSSELITCISFFLAAARLGAAIVERNDEIILPEGQKLTQHFYTGIQKDSFPASTQRIDEEWAASRVSSDIGSLAPVSSDETFFYTFSSGTTGVPKITPLSHSMVLHRSLAVAYDFKPAETRFATLLPVGSRPFMARALGALVNGSTIIDGTDRSFWLAQKVNLVSGSVRQMLTYFKGSPLHPKIREAEVFGSKLSFKDAEILLGSFERVQDAIGASEASKFYVNLHFKDMNNQHVVAGQRLDSEVEVIDVLSGLPTNTEEGFLRVRNPYLAKHYIGDPQATQQSFKDGWLYTGDNAVWGSQDTLQVSERSNNMLNFGGVKVHAAVLDRILRSTRGIQEAITFKNPKADAPDEVFAFVIYEEGTNQIQAAEAARIRVEELMGPTFVPKVIRGVSGLPRLADGTADRQACAQLILEISAARGAARS